MELLQALRSFLITPVHAQTAAPSDAALGLNITNISSLGYMITNVIIIVGVVVVLIMLALGFFKYLTSQGDKMAVESAQKTLTYAVIGAVGLLLVFSIRTIVYNLIGANNINVNNY